MIDLISLFTNIFIGYILIATVINLFLIFYYIIDGFYLNCYTGNRKLDEIISLINRDTTTIFFVSFLWIGVLLHLFEKE
ncbi:hypothetical protein [Nostoc phage A1]|nr:hypothetical protein [Nostoc phage A1]